MAKKKHLLNYKRFESSSVNQRMVEGNMELKFYILVNVLIFVIAYLIGLYRSGKG